MYLSLLKIKNFRCFDGNEHIIAFNKGLNVLVGENDSGKSTIMDADIAEESAEYTKQQILQQTSASLLVQANNLPSLALTLIGG